MSRYTGCSPRERELIAQLRARLHSAEGNLRTATEMLEAKIAEERAQESEENDNPTGLSRPPHGEARR